MSDRAQSDRSSSAATPRRRAPRIVAITNENPAWPAVDKAYADEMWQLLLRGLDQEGFTVEPLKFFDDLGALDDFDPNEWLVWNWGEEWAGVAWTEGKVADELERRGFAYTGSSAAVLRFTQDRLAVKQGLQRAGIPTLPASQFRDPARAAEWTTYPAIVKGGHQHASVGIDAHALVRTPGELARRIEFFRTEHQDDAFVEAFLDTREFQVAVWGNDEPEALPPTEIVFSGFTEMHDRIHTQQWKMDCDSRGYREITMPCPAPLDRPDWRARLEASAVAAYRALGLRDYARFDFRMLADEPQVIDVNSNPALDALSVVAAGARARGLNYGQLAARIVEFAAPRMSTAVGGRPSAKKNPATR